MGYDMYLVGDATNEAEVAAATERMNKVRAERDRLKEAGEGPQWFTPEEEALPEAQKQALGTARMEEADRLAREQNVDYFRARALVSGKQPTDAWLAAEDEFWAAAAQQDRADKNYFRLNIWGMGKMRDSLDALGMLAYEYPMSDWPEAPDDVDESVLEESWELDDPTQHPDPKVAAYHQALEGHRSWSPPDEPGLPVHKFGSNDGWHVTPRDCEGALAIYDVQVKENPDLVEKVRGDWASDREGNTFDDWIAWLRIAAQHGGFKVH